MLNTTEVILDSGLGDHVFRDSDLSIIFKGTPASRYGLVNKAMKKGEIIQIRRGMYTLAPKYQEKYFSLYYIANQMVPHSYVTAESALQYHQWIPERVNQVISLINTGRKKEFSSIYAKFIYYLHHILPENFYTGVTLVKIQDKNVFIASPLRALMDYVYIHKLTNVNKKYLLENLRIDLELINLIKVKEIKQMMPVYKSNYVKTFLNNLMKESK